MGSLAPIGLRSPLHHSLPDLTSSPKWKESKSSYCEMMEGIVHRVSKISVHKVVDVGMDIDIAIPVGKNIR